MIWQIYCTCRPARQLSNWEFSSAMITLRKGINSVIRFKNAQDAIEFLQQQSGDYKVTTKSAKVQQALDFTRALYSFAPLDDFPIDPEIDRERSPDEETSGDRPALPASLDLSLLTLEPVEFSLAGCHHSPPSSRILIKHLTTSLPSSRNYSSIPLSNSTRH